jgi:uncharacterized protein YqgC (DUF456 family)
MSPVVWWIAAVLLIVIGIIGVFLPAVPGVTLVLAGMMLGAWIDGFTRVGWMTLAILAALTALALLADVVGGLIGAKRVGASRLALIGAAIGGLVGLFFGLIGALIGPFVGAVAGELASRRRLGQAARVGLGTWVGLALSLVAKVVIVFMMLAVFITSYLV